MSREALFGYLAAFITIILALALSDMIFSLHRLLRARGRVRWAALPLVAAAWIYLGLLSGFFSLWTALQVTSIGYPLLVWQTFVPTTLALAAFASLPDEVPAEGLDLADFYERSRRYLIVVLAISFAGDLINNIAQAVAQGHGWPAHRYWLFVLRAYGVVFAGMALVWSGPARWRHALGWALLYGGVGQGYLGWTATAR